MKMVDKGAKCRMKQTVSCGDITDITFERLERFPALNHLAITDAQPHWLAGVHQAKPRRDFHESA